MTDEELKLALEKQATQDYRLSRILEMVEQWPPKGATQWRIMRAGLLELSRHATVMEKLAQQVLDLSARPLDVGRLVDSIRKEVEL